MGVADKLDRELPFLRRYARAVTGSGERGDALVEDMLIALQDSDEKGVERIDLFTRLDKQMTALDLKDDSIDVSALSNSSRRALLLTAMEGFSLTDTATIMGRSASGVSDLIASAEQALTESLATDVFIIEDEPLVAAHIAQIAAELGHTVIGLAVTRDAAVAACAELQPGLILADVQLADGSSGIDAVADITSRIDVPVIFITAYPQRLLTGGRGEPAFLIPKPFRPDMVKAVMSQALIQQSLRHAAKK